MKRMRKALAFIAIGVLLLGMVPMQVYADSKNYISIEPSAEKPTVVVSNSDDATYQWYQSKLEEAATIKALTPEVVDNSILALSSNENVENNGMWESKYNGIYLDCVLQAGDVLQVIPSDEFAGAVRLPAHGVTLVEDANGVYSYEIPSDYYGARLSISQAENDFTAKVQVVRGENTYPVVNVSDKKEADEKYQFPYDGTSNAQGWVSTDCEIDIELELEEGEVIKIVPEETFAGTVLIDDVEIEKGADGNYYYNASYVGKTYLEMEDATDFTAKIMSCQYVLDEAVEGQNTATLTEADHDAVYACKITYSNGEVLVSKHVSMQYQIVKQPIAGEQTVGVNFQKGASYQWYETEEAKIALTDEEIIQSMRGTYNSADGLWYDNDIIALSFMVNKGDVLIITPTEDTLAGSVMAGFDTGTILESTDGVYEYVAEQAGELAVVIQEPGDVGVKLELKTEALADALTGETAATLVGGEYGKSYVCKVTWENGVTEISNAITLKEGLSLQPSKGKAEVAVNFPDSVDSYQWHLVNTSSLLVTNYTGIYKDGVGYASCDKGTYSNDVWQSEDHTLELNMLAEAGDTIVITPTDDGVLDRMDIYANSANAAITVENGSYVCSMRTSGGFYVAIDRDMDYSVKVKLVKADGSTYEIKQYDYDEKTEIEANIGAGNCKNGIFQSTETHNEDGENVYVMSLVITLQKGDVLTISSETNIPEGVYLINLQTDEEVRMVQVNGVYQAEIGEAGEYIIYAMDEEAFAMKIEAARESLSTAVDGQTTAVLNNHKAGSYACVVTLKDGTKLVSKTVELTDADIQHVYDDEYDLDCNVCGATREVEKQPDNENIQNKGDAQMPLFYAIGFVLLGIGLVGVRKVRRV